MNKTKRVRAGRGWHLLKAGMLKQPRDQVREKPGSWVPIHSSEYGREIGVNELPHRRPNDPPTGSPDRVYLNNPPGDDPTTAFIESDREDSAERIFEAVCVALIAEAVTERRQIEKQHDKQQRSHDLLSLGVRLSKDLEVARQMAENAAEIAYPTPAPKGDELPEVVV